MKTILIADPSELFTEALSHALAPRFHVHICHNGVDALRLLQELRPDILILQLTLPYIDGIFWQRRNNRSHCSAAIK